MGDPRAPVVRFGRWSARNQAMMARPGNLIHLTRRLSMDTALNAFSPRSVHFPVDLNDSTAISRLSSEGRSLLLPWMSRSLTLLHRSLPGR